MAYGTLSRLYVEKTRAELDDLASLGILVVGNAFSSVLLVKGQPGEVERAGGSLLSGADGTALRAALLKLGSAPEDWCGMACWLKTGEQLSSPRGRRCEQLSPEQLRLAVATLDPATLVACDRAAAELVRNAYLDGLLGLELGRVSMVRGMRVLNLGDFEAALQSMDTKQVMWARLKQIPPLAAPY